MIWASLAALAIGAIVAAAMAGLRHVCDADAEMEREAREL